MKSYESTGAFEVVCSSRGVGKASLEAVVVTYEELQAEMTSSTAVARNFAQVRGSFDPSGA